MGKGDQLTITDVLERASQYLEEDDLAGIHDAYLFAEEAHADQYRKSGEPYIVHPTHVANILVELEMDPATIISGFLHDVAEDTEHSIETIKEAFDSEVAMLVDGVTKLGKIRYKSREAIQAENHRKMFVAMAKDIRVILIKLADRLHNMRTLGYLSSEKQRRISNETLEIFAPLAHRLGISTIKWELEDTALRYLNPQQYYRIVDLMKQKREQREQYIDDVINEINQQLTNVQIDAEISGRPKHLYSIYRKMVTQDVQFNEIYDLLAVRVIVDSIKDCYAVLGIIHTCWKPMPGRFKDYIAMPKPNLYQSLHTTVIGPAGDPLEVQIRTKDMHEIAEYGIAAHWAYKEGRQLNKDDRAFEEKLSWFREILDWQNETHDAEEFMESLKVDLFSDMVYVFTPKGDVIELPSGSTPIDFAYRIHTEIGNQTIGAKVNGKMEPLDYQLQNGDIVEVLTSEHSYGPSQDWLKISQTSKAKNKIKQFFKKQRKEENISKGKKSVEQEITALNIDVKEALAEKNINRTLEKYNFSNEQDMYAAVGYQGVTAGAVASTLTENIQPQQEEHEFTQDLSALMDEMTPKETEKKKSSSGVIVEGVDNLLVRLAKCCHPVPGDEIIGYITKGRGISVHRTDCPNIQSKEAKERTLTVDWHHEKSDLKQYQLDLEITGYDRQGFLNDILQTISELNTDISQVNGRSDKNQIAVIQVTILIQHKEHLKKIVERVKQIKDVYTVERVIN